MFLESVEDELWKDYRGVRWEHAEVSATLDVAEGALRRTLTSLRLNNASLLVRKERAVGVVPRPGFPPLSYEVLEELALATQGALGAHAGPVPMCAFNGGRDVFCDVGTKALGIRALQGLLGATPQRTVHVGDRFTRTGNDVRARDVASTLWVASPRETVALMELLVPLLQTGGGAGGVPPAAHQLPLLRLFGSGEGGVGGAAAGGGASSATSSASSGSPVMPRLAVPSAHQQLHRPALSPLKLGSGGDGSCGDAGEGGGEGGGSGGGGGGGVAFSPYRLSAHGSAGSLSWSPRSTAGPGVGSEAAFTEVQRDENIAAAASLRFSELNAAGAVVLPS